MKCRLIYLLLLFLCSFKGFCDAGSGRVKSSCGGIAVKNIAGKAGHLFIHHTSPATEEFSWFCDDDNEDDETSESKKELAFPIAGLAQNHFDTLGFSLHSFKKHLCIGGLQEIASTPRYLALRVFRL